MSNDKATLFRKMSNVMSHLDRIEKRGHNSFFNYDFVTSDDVLDAVRKAMVKEGLALFINMLGASTIETGSIDKAGKPKVKHVAEFEFNFADSETGEVLTCLWQGEAMDGEDKALSKCATSAEKYFLLKTFLIGTGDEPDPDESDDTGQKSSTKRPSNNKPEPVKPAQPEPKAENGTGEKPWVMPDFPEDLPEMSMDMAMTYTTKTGILYADVPSAELVYHAGSLLKTWRTDESAALKLSAIRTHLMSRQSIPAA